jgi:hypothetical protein
MLYWEEDHEAKRKKHREEKLRAKKFGNIGPTVEENENVVKEDSTEPEKPVVQGDSSVSELKSKIDELSAVIMQQQALLKAILEKEPATVVREVTKDLAIEPEFKKLDDVDVNILDTSGIESVGGQAGKTTEGANISDQLSKLRKLRKTKK